MTIDIASATAEDFDPFTGDVFEVVAAPEGLRLSLDNVKRFERSMVRDSTVEIEGVQIAPRKAFALTFEGPREPLLESRMYELRHAELGTLTLFLSPFRQDRTCMLYEAVFN